MSDKWAFTYSEIPVFTENKKSHIKKNGFNGLAPWFKGLSRHRIIKRITPKWQNLNDVRYIYFIAKNKSRITGIQYQVDHIIPVKHPLVCGLHVKENLRIVEKYHNRFSFESHFNKF